MPDSYPALLQELKQPIQQSQARASMSVNCELVLLYWHIGQDILVRQEREHWGAKVIDRLAVDLKKAFPEMKGFSPRNLRYPDDRPSIGLIICKTKNQIIAEYALRNSTTPIGISEYRLAESLPADLKGSLPTIEELENELGRAKDAE
jgi:hypothetical protein